MSMIRSVTAVGPDSSRNRSSGNNGVSLSKFLRSLTLSTLMSLTFSTSRSAQYFSLSLGWRTLPVTTSPLRSWCLRTCDIET